MSLVRYVERNPFRANLVKRAEDRRWGSAWRRTNGTPKQKKLLSEWPVPMPRGYVAFLNAPQTQSEIDDMRRSIIRGSPYGSHPWTENVIEQFKLGTTIRPRGRPKKVPDTFSLTPFSPRSLAR